MKSLALIILLLGIYTCVVWSLNDQLREVFSWRQLDFEFPDDNARQTAIKNGQYIQANNMPLGLEVWRDKLFITVPRWKAGVASTLNYVSIGSDTNRDRSPRLVPYPNYAMNVLPGRGQHAADHVINTFRLSVDHACDRLWVIDMGQANGTIYGQPQILVFDLLTDRLVRRFTVTADLKRQKPVTWFPGLVADSEPGRCDRSFAYLPDISWGMVVYSFRDNTAWRMEHNYFYFDPIATVFNIGGVRLQWQDGLFGLALSNRRDDGHRTLYFHAMSSTRMFSVDTRVLQSNRSVSESFDEYRHLGHRTSGMQAGAMTADPATETLFYTLVNQDAVGCWNPARSGDVHSPDTAAIVARDAVRLEFPSDIKVDADSNLWVLSDRMPRFRFRVHEFDFNDVNYRVFSGPVADIVSGTVCEPTAASRPYRPTTNRPRPTSSSGWNTPSD